MRKRNRTISIRVSEQEYEAIQKKIQSSQQTQQSFVLNASEGAAILTAKDSKLLKDISMQLADLLKQVKGIAVNINQLAYKANAYGEIPKERQLREYSTQTEALRREADAIWQLIRQSGAMRNCMEYVLRDSKINSSLVYVSGPFDAEEITYDTVYRSF